ncbi:MAG TPA: aldo/keto reductase [Tepidisphaeraceae bacterium]|nr:aldo/keto reductase [Tepidisphaeraceae bacterium]
MKYRALGRTGFNVSEVSFGAWAIGGAWGDVDDATSLRTLHRAIDRGVNFIDTADVYGDGRSERLIAQLKRERPSDTIIVATKAGRRLDPHTAPGYNRANLTAFIERSLKNLQTDALDLVQLHCPPTEVYYEPDVFGVLDDLTQAGKIRNYGVSVEKVEEALKATELPNVKTVQIIFNLFRHRPSERFFPLAKERKIGILARVPLASGLLTGKINQHTQFAADDHRNFNRHGEAFDVGETFSGVDFDTALKAVDELRPLVPAGATMAQFALRWILMFDAISCVIPGAKRPEQLDDNVAAAGLPALPAGTMAKANEIYHRLIRPLVHQRW